MEMTSEIPSPEKGRDEQPSLETREEFLLEGSSGEEILQLLETSEELRSHVDLNRDSWGRWVLTCRSCSHTLTSVRSATSHRCHFECSRCGAEENTLAGIRTHAASSCLVSCATGGQESASYQCQFCPVSFANERQLQEHQETYVVECLRKYADLLKERGLAETAPIDPQPLPKRGRPRKTTDCTSCQLVFSDLASLALHVKQCHPEEMSHLCRLCPERFLHKKELQLHIVEHFLGSFACEFCCIHFSRKYPFLRHMEAEHTGDFLLKCEFCEFTTGNFDEYRRHRHQPHNCESEEAVVCNECGELFPQDEAEEHREEHRSSQKPAPLPTPLPPSSARRVVPLRRRGRTRNRSNKAHRCAECKLVFSSPAAMSRHNYALHPQRFTNICETCGHRFKGKRALELHLEGHVSGTCWCPVCKLKFRHRIHVEKHFQRSHPDVDTFPCEYCDNHLASYSKYIYHCQTAHADLLKDRVDLACGDCGKAFASRILLNQHMAKQHGLNRQNAPKQECPVCKKFFVHVDVHMNLHTRAIQFPCEECGEVFFQRSSLHAHNKLRHDPTARSFSCQVCGKGFISNALLRTHNEQVHLQKRQYFCEICGKRYKNKSALTYHLKVHRGERPYKCKECGQGFHRPSTLKTHLEGTHHLPYTYLYRKPQRLAVSAATLRGAPNLEDNPRSVSSEGEEISQEKVLERMGVSRNVSIVEAVEEVDSAGGVARVEEVQVSTMAESEIVTVVEELHHLPELYRDAGEDGVYIIRVMDET